MGEVKAVFRESSYCAAPKIIWDLRIYECVYDVRVGFEMGQTVKPAWGFA